MRYPYRVQVPECWAPFKKLGQYLDGDQPIFDDAVFQAVMVDLGFQEAPFVETCPVTGEMLPGAGDYETVAGYDNKLYVKFKNAEDAAKFGAAAGMY